MKKLVSSLCLVICFLVGLNNSIAQTSQPFYVPVTDNPHFLTWHGLLNEAFRTWIESFATDPSLYDPDDYFYVTNIVTEVFTQEMTFKTNVVVEGSLTDGDGNPIVGGGGSVLSEVAKYDFDGIDANDLGDVSWLTYDAGDDVYFLRLQEEDDFENWQQRIKNFGSAIDFSNAAIVINPPLKADINENASIFLVIDAYDGTDIDSIGFNEDYGFIGFIPLIPDEVQSGWLLLSQSGSYEFILRRFF